MGGRVTADLLRPGHLDCPLWLRLRLSPADTCSCPALGLAAPSLGEAPPAPPSLPLCSSNDNCTYELSVGWVCLCSSQVQAALCTGPGTWLTPPRYLLSENSRAALKMFTCLSVNNNNRKNVHVSSVFSVPRSGQSPGLFLSLDDIYTAASRKTRKLSVCL